MTSHYSRLDAPLKRFLNPGLNSSRLYQLFLEAEEPRSPTLYKGKRNNNRTAGREISSAAKNQAGFGLPSSDICATCDRLNLQIKSDPSDTGAHQELVDHQDVAEKGYKTMHGDKKEGCPIHTN
ncbi:hypothetical protein OS493_000698 [Desmophyllum pertusum]|uniref:Uncharacterized protein n=1 Tax=Desmophyllum pertusum TaxID=174260 RepID=A0A9X0A7I4_9CNID|nr:hypothetical protein OS493_000698 [Desmophyllum pertusum]